MIIYLILSNSSLASDCLINSNEVCDAAKYLKCNKRDGFSGLSSDYVINACDELFIHITCLFSSLVVYGAVADDMLVSTLVPTPKSKNGNCTVSSSYRAIALSSVLGKIFGRIVMNRYSDMLVSSDLQFGFKQKHSTATCTLVLKNRRIL